MASIKRFVKYVPDNNRQFLDGVDYVYFNSKKWYAVKKDGTKTHTSSSHSKYCINTDLWVESGPVPKNTKNKTTIR